MRRLGFLTVIVALALPATAQAASFFTLSAQYPVGANPYGVVPADFNGDGRIDVAVINGTASTVSSYLGQGDGTFAQEVVDLPQGVVSGPNWGVAGDFTGDGLTDLAVSNYVSDNVTVLQRLPAGGFQPGPSFFVQDSTGVVAADFNGDGLLDLAATSEFSGNVTVALRQGGSFVPEGSFAVGSQPRNLTTDDFNGDGRPDLAIVNDASDNVTILIRNAQGPGFAAEGAAIPVGDRPFGIVSADFNRDGRSDLAVSHYAAGTVQLLMRNAGSTGFEPALPVTVPAGPIGLVARDFDANGVPDLAVASNVGDAVTVLSGGTTPDTSVPLDNAYGVASADFNGDGRPDLAGSSDALNVFAVMVNADRDADGVPDASDNCPTVANPTQAHGDGDALGDACDTPPAPPPGPTQLPDPVSGRNVNATPLEGKVRVKLPGSRNYIDLSQAQQLPVGTSVDARNGTVELVAAGRGGTAKFFDGLFRISQTRGSRPLTTLTLTEQLACPKRNSRASAAAKKKSRKLWGDGKGAFRTSGRYSAATVRGTKWLVTDRCDSTTTRVTQGSVNVRDNVRKRTIIVRKGKSYTARRKR